MSIPLVMYVLGNMYDALRYPKGFVLLVLQQDDEKQDKPGKLGQPHTKKDK